MTALTGQDVPPPGTDEDILVIVRWTHGDVPVARIRTASGVDLGAIAGESAILAVVASWLRSPGRPTPPGEMEHC